MVDGRGTALPRGEAGRLVVRTPGLIDGYFDDPEATGRSFRDGWYDTGDRVEITPEDVLVHLGRADDTIVFDGINVHPSEIENALLRHPAVIESAALPLRDRVRGDFPVAAVVVKSAVTEAQLLSHCVSWIGSRAPVAIMIVPKLPRNATGKVVKREIADLFLAQHRERGRSGNTDKGSIAAERAE